MGWLARRSGGQTTARTARALKKSRAKSRMRRRQDPPADLSLQPLESRESASLLATSHGVVILALPRPEHDGDESYSVVDIRITQAYGSGHKTDNADYRILLSSAPPPSFSSLAAA